MKVVYAGTRQIYGRPDALPVDETHLVRPTDVNGINKAAGEYYHLVYNNVFGVRACSLRLTNVYGPRQLIRTTARASSAGSSGSRSRTTEIQIFGDGSQMRDFVYVDDAVDAFLRGGRQRRRERRGRSTSAAIEPISHRDLVELLIEIAGTGAYASSSGRPRRRPSTSAASTPTRRGSGERPDGRRAVSCARASRARRRSTASTSPTMSTRRVRTVTRARLFNVQAGRGRAAASAPRSIA